MKITDESTIVLNDEKLETNEVNNKTHTWRNVLVGGIPGILLGSASTMFASNHALSENEELKAEVEEFKEEVASLKEEVMQSSGSSYVPKIGDTVDVAHGINDNMSFSEAFAAARAEVGPGGIFTWHGNIYGTYYENEWNNMSDEQKSDYYDAVKHTDYDSDVSHSTQTASAQANYYHEVSNEEDEITVLSEESVETEDGQVINVARVEIEGHYGEIYDLDNDGQADAALIDTNDDGAPDVAMVDENGDGIIEQNEVYQVSDPGMLAMNLATPEDAIYDGMPDYTNDADTTSFA